jgi:hypothetical protein
MQNDGETEQALWSLLGTLISRGYVISLVDQALVSDRRLWTRFLIAHWNGSSQFGISAPGRSILIPMPGFQEKTHLGAVPDREFPS